MKLEVQKVIDNIQNLPEKEIHDNSDLNMILGLVSGSKFCFKRVSLDDIARYINDLDHILEDEYDNEVPKFDLSNMKKARNFNRRAI